MCTLACRAQTGHEKAETYQSTAGAADSHDVSADAATVVLLGALLADIATKLTIASHCSAERYSQMRHRCYVTA